MFKLAWAGMLVILSGIHEPLGPLPAYGFCFPNTAFSVVFMDWPASLSSALAPTALWNESISACPMLIPHGHLHDGIQTLLWTSPLHCDLAVSCGPSCSHAPHRRGPPKRKRWFLNRRFRPRPLLAAPAYISGPCLRLRSPSLKMSLLIVPSLWDFTAPVFTLCPFCHCSWGLLPEFSPGPKAWG